MDQEHVLQRLRTLERESEARSLAAEYCHAVDAQDRPRLAQLFHEDVVIRMNGEHVGREASLALYDRYWDGLDQSRHLVGSLRVHADGDTIRASSYFIVSDVIGSSLRILWGTYDDVFAPVTAGGRLHLLDKRIDVERAVRLEDVFSS